MRNFLNCPAEFFPLISFIPTVTSPVKSKEPLINYARSAFLPQKLQIVRSEPGDSHIPQRFAAEVNAWCQDCLNPYVNFHRPCFFAESVADAQGKTRKRYRLQDMMTPYEKLKSLPHAEAFLKPGITFEQLDKIATTHSDNVAAERLNLARKKLFQSINRRSRHAA